MSASVDERRNGLDEIKFPFLLKSRGSVFIRNPYNRFLYNDCRVLWYITQPFYFVAQSRRNFKNCGMKERS